MTMYRVCLLGPHGKVEAVQRFSADSDKFALAIARDMIKGDSWLAGFELWQDKRRIHAETRKGKRQWKRSASREIRERLSPNSRAIGFIDPFRTSVASVIDPYRSIRRLRTSKGSEVQFLIVRSSRSRTRLGH